MNSETKDMMNVISEGLGKIIESGRSDEFLGEVIGLVDKFSGKRTVVKDKGNAFKRVDVKKITNALLDLGMRADLCGFKYFREGVCQIVNDPTIIDSITKRLYPAIAEKFNSTPTKVERGIRHSIQVAHEKNGATKVNCFLDCDMFTDGKIPKNGELLALVSEKISMGK